ncbi:MULTISPECIES: PhzF family phenazine biosynthesis protein [unclassified Clostridium]|uniref:PhzF family phenazine biosynthesis protein n=1 Tax=unclassified Clostridium TaxID=2614128 RepID=UPI000297C035|nr:MULTISPECIES: PhzF family phenazine biosynthesis protein [unclassified Clostridium]EKQ56976.1 MAG: phenazine biosynthesis protein PhzF family [Clostridium sp. Maddingley MBC34-26]
MIIPMYQVDAFTEEIFKGNPAAICVLEEWIDEKLMQDIANENNLSETAFCVIKNDLCELRWFTPEEEIDLCGHGTLATAYVIFEILNYPKNTVKFQTKSGILTVEKDGENMIMEFPKREGTKTEITHQLIKGLGKEPKEVYISRDIMVVYDNEKDIRDLKPDLEELKLIDAFGIIVTAKGESSDFVSRYFAPSCGIPEDPVTGSAHCTLVPYWSKVLGKNKMIAHQLSTRGGVLNCENAGDKVKISGKARLFFKGDIYITN